MTAATTGATTAETDATIGATAAERGRGSDRTRYQAVARTRYFAAICPVDDREDDAPERVVDGAVNTSSPGVP